MSRVTDINRPYKKRTGEEMHDALQRFCHAAWYPSEGNHRSCFSIPIDDNDADIILSDALRELLDLRQKLANAFIPPPNSIVTVEWSE